MKKEDIKNKKYLKYCLEIAKKGMFYTAPNPMVGCVLVYKDKIIGEGYHKKFGAHHAEVEAIQNSIKNGHQKILNKSTLYVNLEPCCHHGKTPPCTDLITKHKIKEVIIGMKDPNKNIAGKGIIKLKKSNILVKNYELKEAINLNKIFIKNITTSLPYLHAKVALTKDLQLSIKKNTRSKLTSSESNKKTDKLRKQYDAILVGKNTIKIDNPKLTCKSNEKFNPIRIILDSNLSINKDKKILKQAGTTIIANLIKNEKNNNVIYLKCSKNKENQINLTDLIKKLYKIGIYSILIEGGSQVLDSFLNDNLIDKITFIICNKTSNFTSPTPQFILKTNLKQKLTSRQLSEKDIWIEM